MKTNENQQTVLDYIEKFSNASAEAISNGTGIFKLQVHKILKTLLENELVNVDKEGNPPIYSCRAETKPSNESTSKLKKEAQVQKICTIGVLK